MSATHLEAGARQVVGPSPGWWPAEQAACALGYVACSVKRKSSMLERKEDRMDGTRHPGRPRSRPRGCHRRTSPAWLVKPVLRRVRGYAAGGR